MHAVEPLVVDCVLIYFNPTPGFSGRCCRCLKLNKAFNVSAVMLCLRPLYALTPRWRLPHRLWQQLWYMLAHQLCICLYFALDFFSSQIILQSLQYKLQAQYAAFYFFLKESWCHLWKVGQHKFSRMQVKASRGCSHLSPLYLISQTIKYSRSQAVVAQVSSFSVWARRTAEYLAEQSYSRDAAWAAGLPGVELPPHCSMCTLIATNTFTHASILIFLWLASEPFLYSCLWVGSQTQ